MNIRRLVPIIIGVVLVAFGVGVLSLRYNDSHKFIDSEFGNIINIKSNDGTVKIGKKGIEVKDGDDHVSIGLGGINVRDGEDHIVVGWDGIKINEGNKSTVRIGGMGNWPRFRSKRIKWETVDEDKLTQIHGINTITVASSFIDVKITAEDRDDIRMHYYGKMKSDVVPNLEFKKEADNLSIELKSSNKNSYTVAGSNVVLEIFVPKSFNGNFSTFTSSADIYMKNLIAENFAISSSSGDIELATLEGKVLNLSTSSGDIETEDCIGEFNVATSSGDISLDNDKTGGNINISSSSGDVSIKFPEDASYKIDGTT